jgi:phosphatidylglycerol:prolipoprotein diacylglycerol transferase
MYPDLVSIGNFTLHTYGLCIALGALLGILFVARGARREGLNQQQLLDLVFYLLIAAIIGSRVFYIILNPGYYLKHPLESLMIWRGGLVFYGGFLFAFPTCYLYLKKHGLPFLKTCDILAPGLALGESLGRIGCFFAGCCYGRPTDLPWGVTFTHPNSLAQLGVSLHPTQLYASAAGVLMFILLVSFRRFKRADGQIVFLYVLLYALGRLIIETFRGDERGLLVAGYLTLTQTIAIVLIPFALGMIIYLGRSKHSSQSSAHR